MRGPQGAQHLRGQPQGLLDAQRPRGDEVAQVGALDELHDEVGDAVDAALVVDGDDAGVGQARRGAGLAPEAGDEVGGVGQVRVHHLQGHAPVQAPVPGDVDGGHAAAGDPVDDFVARVDQPTEEGIRDHEAYSKG